MRILFSFFIVAFFTFTTYAQRGVSTAKLQKTHFSYDEVQVQGIFKDIESVLLQEKEDDFMSRHFLNGNGLEAFKDNLNKYGTKYSSGQLENLLVSSGQIEQEFLSYKGKIREVKLMKEVLGMVGDKGNIPSINAYVNFIMTDGMVQSAKVKLVKSGTSFIIIMKD